MFHQETILNNTLVQIKLSVYYSPRTNNTLQIHPKDQTNSRVLLAPWARNTPKSKDQHKMPLS